MFICILHPNTCAGSLWRMTVVWVSCLYFPTQVTFRYAHCTVMLRFWNKMLTQKISWSLGAVSVWWEKLSRGGGVLVSWTQVLHLQACSSGWCDPAFTYEAENVPGALLWPVTEHSFPLKLPSHHRTLLLPVLLCEELGSSILLW